MDRATFPGADEGAWAGRLSATSRLPLLPPDPRSPVDAVLSRPHGRPASRLSSLALHHTVLGSPYDPEGHLLGRDAACDAARPRPCPSRKRLVGAYYTTSLDLPSEPCAV